MKIMGMKNTHYKRMLKAAKDVLPLCEWLIWSHLKVPENTNEGQYLVLKDVLLRVWIQTKIDYDSIDIKKFELALNYKFGKPNRIIGKEGYFYFVAFIN